MDVLTGAGIKEDGGKNRSDAGGPSGGKGQSDYKRTEVPQALPLEVKFFLPLQEIKGDDSADKEAEEDDQNPPAIRIVSRWEEMNWPRNVAEAPRAVKRVLNRERIGEN